MSTESSREAQLEREVGELKQKLENLHVVLDNRQDSFEREVLENQDRRKDIEKLRAQLAQSEAGKAELKTELGWEKAWDLHTKADAGNLACIVLNNSTGEGDEPDWMSEARVLAERIVNREEPAAPEPAKPAGEATWQPPMCPWCPDCEGTEKHGDPKRCDNVWHTPEPTTPEPSASEKVVTVGDVVSEPSSWLKSADQHLRSVRPDEPGRDDAVDNALWCLLGYLRDLEVRLEQEGSK